MPLILQLATVDPALGAAPPRRIEVSQRLTLGRGAENDVVLADPNRYLSKHHCVIDRVGDNAYTITDTSVNGVYLNGSSERLPRDSPVPLSEGAVLWLGGYALSVTAIAPSLGAQIPFGGASGAAALPARIGGGLFEDPLADPDGIAARPPASPTSPYGAAAPIGGEHKLGLAPIGAPPFVPLIPDDVDLFGDSPVSDEWQGASQPDHAPSEQAFFAPPRATGEQIPEDWEMSLASSPRRPRELAQRTPETLGPGARSPQIAGAAASLAGDSAALAAFFAAAGLAGTSLSDAEKISVMQAAGAALAATVKGLTEILAARANTKQEFRIERTMIGAADNNPLKFAESCDAAMRIMLLRRTPGFLPAGPAIEEALGDIKRHQLAVLAAMQLALRTIIARFDPTRLEQRLEEGSFLEGILPGARKARYWELFRVLYKEIAGELEDDFQKVLGTEFARAYREQVDR
jgi:type VI secretion system protein